MSALICGSAVFAGGAGTAVTAGPVVTPTLSDWQFVSGGLLPPDQAACNAAAGGRRCFDPASMASSYNYAGVHSGGLDGRGTTIAIVDSFGSATIAGDLNNFDTQFGLQHMCGEPGVTCTAGMPTFSTLQDQGSPTINAPPSNNGTGQEARNAWGLEVSLDVEWAHATAPMANILLVTTPTAETLGVQGLPQMMNAEQDVAVNHLADVITQSFGAGEGSFASFASLATLRHAFIAAQANHVTVLASSGDGGTSNPVKVPVSTGGPLIPYPSVGWPASDPLVSAVGGTYLCTDATTGMSIDSVSPPAACQSNPGVREVGWLNGGGGYSIFFPKPAYQDTLPPGSTFAGTSAGAPGPNSNMRGIPDVAYQASQRTGVLVYMTQSNTIRSAGTGCGAERPCDSGWYIVGGTSASSPQWAGIVAMADQYSHNLGHGDLGYINAALYAVADNATEYASDFYDVTVGNNGLDAPTIPGYDASRGWDAVTGIGTPNVANLIPDLVAAAT